jgi:hypothetical protein
MPKTIRDGNYLSAFGDAGVSSNPPPLSQSTAGRPHLLHLVQHLDSHLAPSYRFRYLSSRLFPTLGSLPLCQCICAHGPSQRYTVRYGVAAPSVLTREKTT